jgi:hypothetical protein
MKRLAPLVATLALGLMAALAYASAPKAEPKPLLEVGKRYVFLTAAEVKRSASVVEDLGAGWYKMRYVHSDGVERMIWLNLNQVVYFQPEE